MTTATVNWPATSASVPPKEIGFLLRIEGVRGGLDEIQGRLRGFRDRIYSQGNSPDKSVPMPAGIAGNLSESEDRIRSILELIGELEQVF